MLKVGVIGKDGRTSAIIRALEASPRVREVVFLSTGKGDSLGEILAQAKIEKPDYVVIGPEEPLADGAVDELQKMGIPCVGPNKSLARLEASKSFTRELVAEYNILGNPEFRVFHSLEGIEAYLSELLALGGYVIKPDGLTGGKGVKVSDAHLFSVQDGLAYCKELFEVPGSTTVVIEEKLEGEEFSLQAFCSGTQTVDMVVVQDHKRAYDGDLGPNTGGMGSYSCADHSLPFIKPEHLSEAKAINAAVARALFEKTGEKYKGILYGGFMITPKGLRLLEYNARFGDPEALNVLSILKTDFSEICEAIINETLSDVDIRFEPLATVCKYIVPKGYPDHPLKEGEIDLSLVQMDTDSLKIYEASVEPQLASPKKFHLNGSRAIAFVGIAPTTAEAEKIAENAASAAIGPVFHRKDIGTDELISQRIAHVEELLSRDEKGNRSHA